MSWVGCVRRSAPASAISRELVRFDMQALEKPKIWLEYQQGTLTGYGVRAYLLEKLGRARAYCVVPLNINSAKAARPIEELLAGKPAALARIKTQAKAPLEDTAAVNAMRWPLYGALKVTGLPVEASPGGLTKLNRCRIGIPNTHARDAACVGDARILDGWQLPALEIKATGRGTYCRTKLAAQGFPQGYCMGSKTVEAFQTGGTLRAKVPSGARAGNHVERAAVRATGACKVGSADRINTKYCKRLHRADGYGYQQLPALSFRD
jgi:hypothetical protein